jgi:hypothetical protein
MRTRVPRLPINEVNQEDRMTLKTGAFAFAVGLILTAGFAASSGVQAAGAGRQTGPIYSIEGAWYGMTDIPGMPLTPTMDTFTSNALRPGAEGTFLCTVPAALAGGQTPSGHGNWVRLATNTYAFTAMRARMSGTTVVGWAKFWGTITPSSDNDLTGTINVQFYDTNLTPTSPQFSGTLERHRIDITFEQ